MPVAQRLVKRRIYPRHHIQRLKFYLDAGLSTKNSVAIPIICSDEGLGDPNLFKANPEHASFIQYKGANCYPDSTISSIFFRCECTLLKATYETSKVHRLKIGCIPIYSSFGDELDKTDNLSSNTVKGLLELTKESTDKQVSPIFVSGLKTSGNAGYLEMGTDQVGLTTNTLMEYIAFLPANLEGIRDMKKFSMEIGGLLKKIVPQVIYKFMTRDRAAFFNLRRSVNPKVKAMNQYTYCGLIIWLPQEDEFQQTVGHADLASADHVVINLEYSYLEYNENFDMTKT